MQEFANNLKGIQKELRAMTPRILRKNAIATAKSLIKHSFPAVDNDPNTAKGGSVNALAQGQANLARDVNKMFTPLESYSVKELVLAKNEIVFNLENPIEWRNQSMKRAWETQNMEGLYQAFSRGDTDLGALGEYHELQEMIYAEKPTVALQMRMMDGNHRPNGKTPVAVKNRQAIEAFIRERALSIGKSANGWNECLRELGASTFGHLPGKGYGSVTNNGTSITLKNPYGDPNGMVTKSGAMAKVVKEQSDDLRADVKKATDKILEKHQTKAHQGDKTYKV